MSDRTDKVTFKYIFDERYNPRYVNGASGGVTPNNEIVLDFYLERPALPKKISYRLDESSQLAEESERLPIDHKESFVRYVQNGIILDYETAKILQEFLAATIDEYEDRNGLNRTEE